MKIKINEMETYENKNIVIEDFTIYTKQEFLKLIDDLNKIKNKFFSDNDEKIITFSPAKSKEEKEKKGPKKRKYIESGKYIKNNHDEIFKKEVKKYKRRKRAKARIKWEDRNEVLNAIRIHYHGSLDLKRRFAEMKGTDWNRILKAISGLKGRFNVKPEEVGLKEFPVRKERGKPYGF